MSAKTKILVLKMREIIYTAVFLVLAAILIILLISMFTSNSKKAVSHTAQEESTVKSTTARYIAGVYTTPVTLGSSCADVEVIVDEDHINSIRLVNLSEAATVMYPLVSPSLEDISAQICLKQSLDQISCPSENKYTAQVLLNAISAALENATAANWQ